MMAAMSERNFTRVFTQTVGVSPSTYVELTRIDVARFLLEGSRLSMDGVALRKRLCVRPSMRRAFLARIGITPSDYRERFRTSGDGARTNLSENG